jgi:hypothetical protein
MKRSPAGRPLNSVANDYSGIVLSSNTEIRQLRDVARRLMQQDDPWLDPEFFLASVSKGWKPRVVAVYHAHEVVGILFTKERVISGIPTGVVYVDGSLGGILLCNPLHQQNSFRLAIQLLLASPGIHGIRLRVLRGCCELAALRQLLASGSLDAQYCRIKYNRSVLWKYHAHLPLADTYEQFLKGLGHTTRHNFRYYRRRFEESGHTFIDHLTMDELRSVALELGQKCKFTSEAEEVGIENELNMVASTRQPLAVGLKHHNGEWLSVIGGWYKPRGAVLCFQRNDDRDFGPDSLSVVLRAYLIEHLIRQGLEELVIWNDTGPPLLRYVTHVPTLGVRLDARTYLWRVVRRFISTVGPRLPKRLAAAAEWIA